MTVKVDRVLSFPVGGRSLPLPCFFPSISSVKTSMAPIDYVRVLTHLKHPLFLLSAYDIYRTKRTGEFEELQRSVGQAVEQGTIVLMDSGNYEQYWHQDDSWTVDLFHQVLPVFPYHLAFCYDNQAPPGTSEAIAKDVVERVFNDSAAQRSSSGLLPIVHGLASQLPVAVKLVAKNLNPLMIAVPERELGPGILERAQTVAKIRTALNELGWYCPLHLLGTGNPLSILVFTACGADSFDGLEWCQTSVDHTTGFLYHLAQGDFFLHQAQNRTINALPYPLAILAHNSLFYRRWMEEIGSATEQGRLRALLQKYLPGRGWAHLCTSIPEVFQ